jgi:hypothetical protein
MAPHATHAIKKSASHNASGSGKEVVRILGHLTVPPLFAQPRHSSHGKLIRWNHSNTIHFKTVSLSSQPPRRRRRRRRRRGHFFFFSKFKFNLKFLSFFFFFTPSASALLALGRTMFAALLVAIALVGRGCSALYGGDDVIQLTEKDFDKSACLLCRLFPSVHAGATCHPVLMHAAAQPPSTPRASRIFCTPTPLAPPLHSNPSSFFSNSCRKGRGREPC